MSPGPAATRYARVLLEVAIQESDPAVVDTDLDAVARLLATNGELHGAVTNPAVPVHAKRSVIDTILTRLGTCAPVRKLILMLADRDRLSLVPAIGVAYHDRLMAYRRVIRAEITTAAPLADTRVQQLKDALAQATGRDVTLTTAVNPAIIGGGVARVGSTVYDGSLATQLAKMRARLWERR